MRTKWLNPPTAHRRLFQLSVFRFSPALWAVNATESTHETFTDRARSITEAAVSSTVQPLLPTALPQSTSFLKKDRGTQISSSRHSKPILWAMRICVNFCLVQINSETTLKRLTTRQARSHQGLPMWLRTKKTISAIRSDPISAPRQPIFSTATGSAQHPTAEKAVICSTTALIRSTAVPKTDWASVCFQI